MKKENSLNKSFTTNNFVKKFNLTQSDNALALKFARVKDQISKEAKLESIKLALMYYSANQNEENWTIETMKKHEELMVTILEKSYRRTDESVNS